jgi:iron complex outermembrane receptor protein
MQRHFDNRIHMPRRGMMLGTASALIGVWLNVQPALAADAARDYRIPAQSLNNALMTFAADSGLEVVFNADGIRGLNANSLNGRMTPAEALDQLLQGSGYTWRFVNDRTVTLEKRPAQADPSSKVSTLPPMTVTGAAEYDSTDPYNNKDYAAVNATTATKTDTPLMETPMNIQIVPKAVLNDQQAITLGTALNNVSGVTVGTGSGGLSDDIYIRGFRTSTQFRNGFRYDSESSSWGKREMANVEKIEVLKGPAAILYGQMEPGGMVNVVTKQPLTTEYYSAQQQFGSYDLYRTTIDATGPLTKDDTLLYRVNMAYQNNNSYRELVDNERFFVAPVLKWNISPRTQATLEMEYRHDNSINDTMVWPYVNGNFINIPRSRNLMEATPNTLDDIFIGFNWSHEFNDNWKISNQFATERRANSKSVAMLGSGSELTNGTLLNRITVDHPAQINTYYTTLDLTGHFNTFGLQHTLLLGGDYYNTKSFGDYYSGDPAAPIDVYNPVHTGFVNPTTFDRYDNSTDYYGIYAQDQIELPYNVHVMGGLRYQAVVQKNNVEHITSPTVDAVTPRVGLLWQPLKWLSLYGNYVENFGASKGQGFGGKQLPPESAQQWEGGVKAEFYDGRLSATLAYFDLTKQNVATPDPANPLFSVATGEVRSRGPELDIRGEILPGWNAIATYANLDVVVTKDNSGREGKRMYAVPRNIGSLWNTYDFQQGNLKGLKVGGGVSLRDSSTNFPNTYNVPGFATVDLLVAYNLMVHKSNITFQLNVNNLLDKNYFQDVITGLGTNSRVNIGTPRTFIGSIKVEF